MANENDTPRPARPAGPPRRRRALRWLGGTLALLLAMVLAAAGAVWWGLAHERGTAWLLSRLPGVEVVNPHGSLVGDFGADAVVVRFGRGGELRLVRLAWQGLALGRSDAPSAWMRVDLRHLQAQQARLTLPAPAQDNRHPPPDNLNLPVELAIGTFQLDELQSAALGDQPLRDLRLRGLHLHDHGGEVHRLDALSLARGPLRAEGQARLQAQAPMQAEVSIALRQPATAGWPAWQAQLQLAGPLAHAALTGNLRADTTPAQTLTLDAAVQPFAEWPLAQLKAHAQALDVSTLLAGGPQTALSGDVVVRAADAERPLDAQVNLVNHLPGAWNAGRVPVRRLQLALGADPRDTTQLQLQQLQAELGTADALAGRLNGEGRWSASQGWTLQATLQQLRPERLDARAPALLLDGEIHANGQDQPAGPGRAAARHSLDVDARLTGRAPDAPGRAPLQLQLQGSAASSSDGALRLELRRLAASHGAARAAVDGWLQRDAPAAPWRTEAKLAVDDFDPQPWWPALPWRQPSRLNAKADLALTLPPAGPGQAMAAWLATLQGHADLQLSPSTLGGVPLQGEARLRGSGSAEGLQARLQAQVAGNTVQGEGRLARDPARDHWEARIEAPAIERLSPWLPARTALAGMLNGEASADGRWPRLRTQGQLQARQLAAPGVQLHQAAAHWRLGTTPGAPVALQLTLADLLLPGGEKARRVPSAALNLDGTADEHRLSLQADLAAAPPAWTSAAQPAAAASTGPSATGPRTLARLLARGTLLHGGDSPADIAGWKGRIATLDLRRAEAPEPLLRTADVALEFRTAAGGRPARVQVQPGRAQALDGVLRWSRLDWQGGQDTAPAQVDADVTLEPMRVAPLLARLQPAYGWSGDLALAGRLRLHTAPVLRADLLLQRQGGDLQMSQGGGRRALGLETLRVAVRADGTAWQAEARVLGQSVGSLAADFRARTTPSEPWPGAATPVQGTLALRAPDLGVYDPWLPVGWRLGGTLSADARIGGRLGSPEYSGRIQGRQLAVSHFVEGVRVRDGELQATLDGDQLRIERFVVHAGDGTARLEGGARLGAQPSAQLSLTAERFQALSRVDRRIAVSGSAQLALDARHTRLQGRFAVDEGLVDLGRSDAPELSPDVRVVDDPRFSPPPAKSAGGEKRALEMDLHIDLGSRLRVQGRGVNTLLAGDLRVSAPAGQLQLDGTVRTVNGTYQAYGEKLRIERGLVSFRGPVADPRLDIEAVRPDLDDVEVGVAITGTAQNPRVRLISTPEMSDLDKLSWLTMGRASEGLASDQSALLQRAALALLAGQRGGSGEGLAKRLGLDAVSVKRGESGGFSDAVVALGKQVSERFYVGYQQSLDATGMGWELIYKIAKRFTVRVQTGETTAVDLVWTWLWG